MNILRRCVAATLLTLTLTSVLPIGHTPAAEALALTADDTKVVEVQALVRLARIGEGWDMDIQIIEIIRGKSESLIPGETYKVDYPGRASFTANRRERLAKNNPSLFAALNRLKTHDVAHVTFTDTTDSTRRCHNTGTSVGCGASKETHYYKLVAVSARTGTCVQGNKLSATYDWSTDDAKPFACVIAARGSYRIAALVDYFRPKGINSVTVTLSRAGSPALTATSPKGAVNLVTVPGELEAGRYKLGGCIDIRDDGKDCREFPAKAFMYKPR